MSESVAIALPNLGRPLKPTQAKLSTKKRLVVLQALAEGLNLTKAAAKVGVTRQAVRELIKRDQNFAAGYQQVIDLHLDNCEESMFVVASTPSREGYNDRKLALQSHRPETYAPKAQIDHRHTHKHEINLPQLKGILLGQNVSKAKQAELDIPEPIDFTEVE